MAEVASDARTAADVHTWRTLWARRGKHLVRRDRRGWPRPPDEPHAMGHRSDSFRRGRIAPACRFVLRKGVALERLGWIGLAAIVLGAGAPVLLANAGLLFAPAAHAGALFPGVMPLMVAMLAAVILREPFTRHEKAWLRNDPARRHLPSRGTRAASIGSQQNIGHALFLASGLAWACYTVAMRRARLDGLHAPAIAAAGALSLAGFCQTAPWSAFSFFSSSSSTGSEVRGRMCRVASGCSTPIAQPTSRRSPSHCGHAVRACSRSPCASCRARRAPTGSAGTAAGGGTSGRGRPSGRRNRNASSASRSS